MIERYLSCRHEFGGRGPDAFDCWGQVRDVRHNVFGLPLLPSYGAIADGDKRALTKTWHADMQSFKPVAPCPSALATVWRGLLCIHIAIVVEIDGRLAVLETNPQTGPRWLPLRDFERNYLRVVYYHDA